MKALYSVLLLFVSFITNAQTKSVLFIGNSYTAVNDLPTLVYNIALANGDTIVYDSHTPGGSYFNMHKTNATTLAKIASKNWDVVILQEQSQLPTLPEEIAGDDYTPPSATDLVNIIRENDACTEIVFYMTWGRKEGDASFCADVPAVCTYEGMQLSLRNAYLNMAEVNNAAVSPVGMGWKTVIDDDPAIELYMGDGSHPNINGSYLTACIFYATLFQKSPIGNAFHASLTEEDATYFQEMAHAIVFDSLDTWRIGLHDLTAEFTITNEENLYHFNSTSSNATSWLWTIDGTNFLSENVDYTFSDEGIYPIELMVVNACDTLILRDTVTIESVGIDEQNNLVELYPNPVKSTLQIRSTTLETVTVFDLFGRKLGTFNLTETSVIDFSEWPVGTYFVEIGGTYHKIIKQE